METVTQLIIENSDAIAGILVAVSASLMSKAVLWTTKTRDSKWYKLLEALALVGGKVKDKVEK